MKVICQYTVPCSGDSLCWTTADPSRHTDILFHKNTICFYPVFCPWPNYFFLALWSNKSELQLHQHNAFNDHNSNTYVLGRCKVVKMSSFFTIGNKNPRNTIYWAQTTSNRGFTCAYLKWVRFFFLLPTLISNAGSVRSFHK